MKRPVLVFWLLLCSALLPACKKAATAPAVSVRYSGTQVATLEPFVLALSLDPASGNVETLMAEVPTETPQSRTIAPKKDRRVVVTAQFRNVYNTTPVPPGAVIQVEVLVGTAVRRTIRLDASTPYSGGGFQESAVIMDYSDF
ncbi:hypothetical protein I2I05_21480 [Hymenobacter sp. BT683]|uniref:DUF1735 domain-containing protein n=1 Tax=Hymenobacter jeongseonensis TaxID=2791027 RepID=A0ABS0INQ5_9BACT|nr:hypothetical protein [Hymenobacter jeongseonensis]MBF9239977.1 hypothetical protein [Hymenobacter jeongseonensis]